MADPLEPCEVVLPSGAFHTPTRLLATRYDRLLAAVDDNGDVDPTVLRFAAWLADWWHPAGPPEPAGRPDAVSTTRSGVETLRWYAMPGFVRAYQRGARGCYLVPVDAVEGALP